MLVVRCCRRGERLAPFPLRNCAQSRSTVAGSDSGYPVTATYPNARSATGRPALIRRQRRIRGNFFACSALTSAAYRSTYSCPESPRIAYMISSVTARRMAFSLSMPS